MKTQVKCTIVHPLFSGLYWPVFEMMMGPEQFSLHRLATLIDPQRQRDLTTVLPSRVNIPVITLASPKRQTKDMTTLSTLGINNALPHLIITQRIFLTASLWRKESWYNYIPPKLKQIWRELVTGGHWDLLLEVKEVGRVHLLLPSLLPPIAPFLHPSSSLNPLDKNTIWLEIFETGLSFHFLTHRCDND